MYILVSCRRADNTVLIMLYNAKIEMINRKMLACALRCIKLLKQLLKKGTIITQCTNKKDNLFRYCTLLAEINYRLNFIVNAMMKQVQCSKCSSVARCSHKVTKLIPEMHIK